MQKIKLAILLLIATGLSALTFGVKDAKATTPPAITQLPGYTNYVDFKLSCTPTFSATSARFSSKKDGGSYTDFGPSIDLTANPCQVQVGNGQFGSEGKFWFKVTLSDGTSAETATTLDTTAPGSVSDFGKSRTGGGTVYHLTWKNPTDSDYTRVFIYRGTVAGFESDGNKIVEAGGSPGDTMSYDDGSLDPTKEYYYYIRALDHANNASGLVGDSLTTTVTTTPTPGTGTTGKVTVLPKEEGTTGSVLGTEASPTPEATVQPAQGGVVGPLKWILTHKKISLGIAAALALLSYGFYRLSKRSK